MTVLAHLKATVRPWLRPALRSFGLRRPPAMKVPRVASAERLREHDVPTRVSVRADETLLLNGRPFFPLGVYYAQAEIDDRSGAGLERLRTTGFNTILVDGMLEPDTLDRIARAGLFVWYRPPGQLHGAFDTLKEVVRRVGRHEALLAWEMDDEPILNDLSIDIARRGCDLVRRIDPFHPILCNQWLPGADRLDEVRRWASLVDVYGFGIYPVPMRRWRTRTRPDGNGLPDSIAVVGAQVALWRKLAPGKPVIPALQAFAWNALEDADAGFPTASESRFMAYHAVIAGAKGLHHFGVPTADVPCFPCGVPPALNADLNRTHEDFLAARDANERFWTQYRHVIAELASMAEVFTAPDAATAVDAGDVQYRVKAVAGSSVVLAVNTAATGTRHILQAPTLAGRPLHLWGGNRTIDADTRGCFPGQFEPFGVRIFSDLPDRLPHASGGA